MELELRHLKVVSTIAAAGSVTKAAAELGVAQPALTAQLGRIERTLGGPLFERDHRGVQGVTSGGSGNCTVGGTTYFQPVGEILSAYGLTLLRHRSPASESPFRRGEACR